MKFGDSLAVRHIVILTLSVRASALGGNVVDHATTRSAGVHHAGTSPAPQPPADAEHAGDRQHRDDCDRGRQHDDRSLQRRHDHHQAASRADARRPFGSRRGLRRDVWHGGCTMVLRTTSFDGLGAAPSTTAAIPADATKPHRIDAADARGTVQTPRRATVQRRRAVFVVGVDGVVDAVGSRAVAAEVGGGGGGAELAERTVVAGRAAAREAVQTVDADGAVETRSAKLPAVVDVGVAATSGVADCADAPETVALVDAATCVHSQSQRE